MSDPTGMGEGHRCPPMTRSPLCRCCRGRSFTDWVTSRSTSPRTPVRSPRAWKSARDTLASGTGSLAQPPSPIHTDNTRT